MKNSEYWKSRFEQLEQAQNGQGMAAFAEIEKQYKETQKQLEGQIARWYQRFADNNGISLAEARQYLKGADLKEFKWDVQDYIKYGQDNALTGGWMKELENASAKFHISKLEALKMRTQQSLEVMFSKQLGTVNRAMADIYENGYFHTAYELQKGFNIGWDIAGLDQSQIEKVLAKPWAVDSKNFSERIWGNKEKLISEVHSELTQNIMLGADPQKAIDSLAKKMNTSKHNAGRLIMTEEAYFSSAAQRDCFNNLDVEQYEIIATLDSHTSDVCRSLDGKVFPMKDFEPGITAPPFHVFCRSTTIPYFEDNFGQVGERAARDEEIGKTYYVPADMNYREWQEKFVKGKSKKENTDYLVRSHTPGQNIIKERMTVNEVISSMPEKIQKALNSGTIIDIGKEGASQYDYFRDILYVAKGADKTEIIHEIGHMVENKLLDTQRVLELKQQILKDVIPDNFVKEIYYDASDNPVEIFLIKSDKFVSEYQGRVYIHDWSELLDENMLVRPELLAEFMSEPFREYIERPERLKREFPQFYQMISEVLQ
ncbi:minor capsid protein [Lachnospiraceae bacterium 46-15]